MSGEYGNDRAHADAERKYALDIFDCRVRFTFYRRERMYLQTAAITTTSESSWR
jgi:hypothetical protein